MMLKRFISEYEVKMRPTKLFPIFISFAFALFGTLAVFAQDAAPPDAKPARGPRPNLLAALGLTPEQIDQIKQINADQRPQLQQSVRRFREANRALNMAVYADVLNELDVQTRLREYQAAQSRLAGLRFGTELAVRKVLTPDQLVKFRDLRRRFAEQRATDQQQQRRRRPFGPGAGGPKPGQQASAPPS